MLKRCAEGEYLMIICVFLQSDEFYASVQVSRECSRGVPKASTLWLSASHIHLHKFERFIGTARMLKRFANGEYLINIRVFL